MRVTCHRVRAVTRRLARNGCHSSKAIYFVASVAGCRIGSSFSAWHFRPPPATTKFHTLYHHPRVTYAAHAFCAIFIINGNEVKWIVWRHVFIAEWLPLSGSTRSAARKRNAGFRLVCTNKGNAGRKAICLLHRIYVASFDGRHIELFLCTMCIERCKFSSRHDMGIAT